MRLASFLFAIFITLTDKNLNSVRLKLPPFFSCREGLPAVDCLPAPSPVFHPLKRVGVLCLCILVLSALVGFVSVLLLEGLLWLEYFASNIVPEAALALLIVAGALAAGWLLKKEGWAKPFARLVYSVTGMPLGPESILLEAAGLLRLGRSFTAAETELLKICVMTAGIASWFGTPLAAFALFAAHFRARSGYLLLAAFTGAALHYAWFGLRLPAPVEMPGVAASGVYVLLGLLMGVLSAAVVRSVQGLQLLRGRYAAMAAVLLIAALVWWKPVLFGPGVGAGRQLLTMENVTLALLIHLASYKLITVIAAAGARFPGAMLTPLMIVGAATGLLTALWLQSLFGSVPLNPSLAAVIGAGALIGGVTRLPLMAVLFALEISRQPAAVVPVALAVAAAYAGSAVFLRRR